MEEQSPVEEVALTVPIIDDPSLLVMTFRMWNLESFLVFLLMFFNTLFSYRTHPLTVSPIFAQIVIILAERFMEVVLLERPMRVPLIGWEFSLNPGPFNMKEHVVMRIFANVGVAFGGGDQSMGKI